LKRAGLVRKEQFGTEYEIYFSISQIF